jgi:hypothetical protein
MGKTKKTKENKKRENYLAWAENTAGPFVLSISTRPNPTQYAIAPMMREPAWSVTDAWGHAHRTASSFATNTTMCPAHLATEFVELS